MNCPVCNEELKSTEATAPLTCKGSTWAPHEPITYNADDGSFHTTSPAMVQWFRDNGFAVTNSGSNYVMRQKKGVLSRLLRR
jgi:hypothetical protein